MMILGASYLCGRMHEESENNFPDDRQTCNEKRTSSGHVVWQNNFIKHLRLDLAASLSLLITYLLKRVNAPRSAEGMLKDFMA